MDFRIKVMADLDGKNLESQLNKLKAKPTKIPVELDIKNSDFNKFVQNINKVAKKINLSVETAGVRQANEQVRQLSQSAKQLSNFKFKIDTKGTVADISSLSAQIKKLEAQVSSTGKQSSQLKSLQDSFKNLKNIETSLSGKKVLDEKDITAYNTALKTTQNLAKALKGDLSEITTVSDRVKFTNKMQTWLKGNTKATEEAKQSINEYINAVNNAGDKLSKGELTNLSKQFDATVSAMKASGNVGNSIKAEFGRAFSQIGQFVGIYGILQQGLQTTRQMVKAVYDVDTAMTNLYKVTDETASRYDKFMSDSAKNAKSLGRDISSYIEQTATWAKLGYNLDQSSELAKTSSIYANVGEVDDETAVSDIVTAMKAYDIAADDSVQIIDKLNKLGNEFATSSADIGEGLSNAASALALGGMDINKSLALITGGAEITQSAGEMGNALKIGQMRVMGMKGALEELGEESEGLESVSKIQTHILNATKGQVNIMNSADPTKFRDYYDILKDVSDVYDDLSQTTQADLLETLFGKQRGNQGAALIQAFQSGQIQKAYQATLNAEGSAQQEQDRWMDSMEAKVQQFKAQFQELSNTAFESDFLKGLTDSGTGFLNVLTEIIDVGGGLPALLTAIGGIKLFKNLDLFYY